jgi:8-oxo-dGTP pyrophosphatase MutT (NUDIX family)
MTNYTLPPEDDHHPGIGSIAYGLTADNEEFASGPWPPEPAGNVKVVSAGGLVFHQSGDLIETLLCARARPGYQGEDAPLTWRLPKGTPEHGETVMETAQREVQEETGVRVNVLAPITSIHYFFVGHDDGIRYDKTVYFYLMEPLGGSTSDHDAEFDVVEWCGYEQALELLEYDNERSVLEAARSLIETYREGGG